MKRALIATFAALACSTAAFADSDPTDEEKAKIIDAMKAWGCSGGEIEKETEGTSVFEVDDAECPQGQYDLKLDKNYHLNSMTRD